ncbi:MAG: hypothetical protein Q4E43_04200 [Akkermansia sp.]|nr:hypothetical protein [Akkermansia sp.]
MKFFAKNAKKSPRAERWRNSSLDFTFPPARTQGKNTLYQQIFGGALVWLPVYRMLAIRRFFIF